MSWNFNWQEEPEGFAKWLMPHLIVGVSQERLEELSDLTDRFTDVRLTVQVNGVELDASRFFEAVQSNMEYWSKRAAEDTLRDNLNDLFDPLSELRDEFRRSVLRRLRERGIHLDLD